MKAKRTKALEIPKEVKEAVAERDKVKGWTCCVLCGTPAPPENPLAFSNAHFIPRSKGGLGVEKNIVSLCPHCHRQYDQSGERGFIKAELKGYLQGKYADWNEEELCYEKGM